MRADLLLVQEVAEFEQDHEDFLRQENERGQGLRSTLSLLPFNLTTAVRRWLPTSCLLATLAGTAIPLGAAEPPAETAPAAQETAPAAAPKRVEVKVELRWRNEFRDNADFQPADDFDHFLGQRIRVWLLVRAHSHLSFTVEGQDVWLFDAASDKIIHNTATNLHQAYLDWKPGGSEHWELRAGRQEFIYGRERLVGAFGWDNVGRSFDAARLRHRRAEWTSDFFWGRLMDIRRASARHRPGNQDLYGIYVSRAPQGSPGRTEVYAFVLHDGLRSGGERAFRLEGTDILTLGFRRAWTPATGFRYEVENTWQFGERGSDSHRGAAFIGSGGYAWGGR